MLHCNPPGRPLRQRHVHRAPHPQRSKHRGRIARYNYFIPADYTPLLY